jgi:hypothetical protein
MFLVTASSKLDSKFKIPDYRSSAFAIDRKPKIAMVFLCGDPIWLSESTNPGN